MVISQTLGELVPDDSVHWNIFVPPGSCIKLWSVFRLADNQIMPLLVHAYITVIYVYIYTCVCA